jgi:hypothetical protein
MAQITLVLSGIHLALHGLSSSLEQSFRERWGRYVSDDAQDAWLDVRVSVAGDPVAGGTLTMDRLVAEFEGAVARFSMSEGTIELSGHESARVRLAPASSDTQHFVLVNLICAALACALPSRGAALLHAAGCVLEGQAFLLVGSAGSGKSTWIEQARRGGATALSDDLIFVDTAGERVEALSTPIRGYYPEPRRWPVAALLFPVHGTPPSVSPVASLRAVSRVTANLPFVAERLGADDRFHEVVGRLISAVPAYDLTFAQDPSFLDCLKTLTPRIPEQSE